MGWLYLLWVGMAEQRNVGNVLMIRTLIFVAHLGLRDIGAFKGKPNSR